MKVYKYIIVGLLSLFTSVSAIQASALFDGTAADAWHIDPSTGQVVGYDLGSTWLDQYIAGNFSALSLSANDAILINTVSNSSVPMTQGQPALSLVGIGERALLVGQSANNNLRITPVAATYNSTIEVKIIVSSTLFKQSNYELSWKVGDKPQQAIVLNANTSAPDGYFTQSLFLVEEGLHPVSVELKNISSSGGLAKTVNYTIQTCIEGMSESACTAQLRRDSDGDGIPDIVELDIGLNPLTDDLNADLNGDGWSEFDVWLRRFCLDPETQQPSDDISCLDSNGLPLDSDKDNWSDFDEILRGTNYQDPEPYLEGGSSTDTPLTLPDLKFCASDDIFYFNLAFEATGEEVIFRIGADGSPFLPPVESIGINFDQNGEVTRLSPTVQTFEAPAKDRWLDGEISDFTLSTLSSGVWRIKGSIPVGNDPFIAGESVNTIYIREPSGTRSLGSVEVSADISTCETVETPTQPTSKQRLRFKDFPAATRLYEVEHVLDNGTLTIPPLATKTVDQQSIGDKKTEYAGVVVQSYTAARDNLTAVSVVVAADESIIQDFDDITLNIWGDSLRGTLLLSQTLRNVQINNKFDHTITFEFEAVPQQIGEVYYFEIRKNKAKLLGADLDTYQNGAIVEFNGLARTGLEDIIFTTYYDSAFANNTSGTPTGMFWKQVVASGINGKPIYDSTRLLSNTEIISANLSPTDVVDRLRVSSVVAAFASNNLPRLRLPASESFAISVIHSLEAQANDLYEKPAGYERIYKQWLPRYSDVTPDVILDDLDMGEWSSPNEWRNSFIAALLPRLTKLSAPDLSVESTLPINAIEAVLSEESVLQGEATQQLFASSSHSARPQFAKAWEKSLRRFNSPNYNLDTALIELLEALSSNQLLALQNDWFKRMFYSSKPGSRSDQYISSQFHQSYRSDCFISSDDLPDLQSDDVKWNYFLTSCPNFYSESELNQYLVDDQVRQYQLRVMLMPNAISTVLEDLSILDILIDSDADTLDNLEEINRSVNNLTLPWVADSDGDGISDGEDPCPNDIFNNCSETPILPIITTDMDLSISEPFNGSDIALVGVRLNRIYNKDITVFYEVFVATGNTATAGEDFTQMTGSVIIKAGHKSALIEVPVFSDDLTEGAENFSLRITSADNAEIGGDGVVTITLNDPGMPYTIGGVVTDLDGTVVLQNSNGDSISVNSDGSFVFPTVVGEGLSYSVSVTSQPIGQICKVSNFSGTATNNITDVIVSCTSDTAFYTVGGNVVGLTGSLLLQNNNSDNLSVNTDGSFTFSTAISNGSGYEVSIYTQPNGQFCSVANNSGTVNSSDVTSVSISCIPLSLPDNPTNFAVIASNPKTLTFSWDAASGATSYKLLKNSDGYSGFSELFVDITALTIDELVPVHLYDWANASYTLEACNDSGCSTSGTITSKSAMLEAIGYFKASNTGYDDQFGYSVALSADGKTLAVGATREDSAATGLDGDQSDNSASNAGAVYVFTRSTNSPEAWQQQAYLKASNAGAGDSFGQALSLSADGNTLAVGAHGENSNATTINGDESNDASNDSGAAYVFTRNAGSWAQQAYIKASDSSQSDLFGVAVALSADGNTLAVGASGEDSDEVGISLDGNKYNFSASNSGAVYVFTRSSENWSQQAYVKASNSGAGDAFGGGSLGLSSDGNVLAVGAIHESSNATGINGNEIDNSSERSGAAYVFRRNTGQWTQEAYIKASNAEAFDLFASKLALSAEGNTLAVGAMNEKSSAVGINGDQTRNDTSNSGAVYVFTHTLGSWTQEAYIKASNTDESDEFGSSITISSDGNTLAVGAPRERGFDKGINGYEASNNYVNAGAVYVFKRDDVWSQQAYVKASNTWGGDTFAGSVALSADGDTLVVGAKYEKSKATGINGDQSDKTLSFSGAVYLY